MAAGVGGERELGQRRPGRIRPAAHEALPLTKVCNLERSVCLL